MRFAGSCVWLHPSEVCGVLCLPAKPWRFSELVLYHWTNHNVPNVESSEPLAGQSSHGFISKNVFKCFRLVMVAKCSLMMLGDGCEVFIDNAWWWLRSVHWWCLVMVAKCPLMMLGDGCEVFIDDAWWWLQSVHWWCLVMIAKCPLMMLGDGCKVSIDDAWRWLHSVHWRCLVMVAKCPLMVHTVVTNGCVSIDIMVTNCAMVIETPVWLLNCTHGWMFVGNWLHICTNGCTVCEPLVAQFYERLHQFVC